MSRGEPRVTIISDFTQLEISLDSFDIDVGRYPTEREGLSALWDVPLGTESRWHGPYIKPRVVRDPWGRPYVYHLVGEAPHDSYRLISRGPDGIEGTADDIVNFDFMRGK
ncbi:MAG TPA: type II secretion system protein GspG [Tepidisphaeraceae bacterium]|nr:type II secretion system protein GspG [Tepidisphaeraceae bacterium]